MEGSMNIFYLVPESVGIGMEFVIREFFFFLLQF